MKTAVVPSQIGDAKATLYYGADALTALSMLPESQVQCCITSPPYWGLRDYGVEPQSWPEVRYCPMPGMEIEIVIPAMDVALGLEEEPTAYVGHLVEVFRSVARTMRKDGVLWLNLGDTYVAGGSTTPESQSAHTYADRCTLAAVPTTGQIARPVKMRTTMGLGSKQLLPIPWLVAFALQADGWLLRSWIPWVRRNSMPGSQQDRPTASCETIFLLAHPESKGQYVYDSEAVKVTATCMRKRGPETSPEQIRTLRTADLFFNSIQNILDGGQELLMNDEGDPLALVVNTVGYHGAHFAVFPPGLVEPLLMAGAPEKGRCPTCGTAWKLPTGHPCKECGGFVPTQANSCPSCGFVNDWKTERGISESFMTTDWSTAGRSVPRKLTAEGKQGAVPAQPRLKKDWRPRCSCPEHEPVPCLVLDPFSGSGTVGWAALQNNRSYIGLDANADFLPLAETRVMCNAAPPKESKEEQDNSIIAMFGM